MGLALLNAATASVDGHRAHAWSRSRHHRSHLLGPRVDADSRPPRFDAPSRCSMIPVAFQVHYANQPSNGLPLVATDREERPPVASCLHAASGAAALCGPELPDDSRRAFLRVAGTSVVSNGGEEPAQSKSEPRRKFLRPQVIPEEGLEPSRPCGHWILRSE
jgi:hypothetical protein